MAACGECDRRSRGAAAEHGPALRAIDGEKLTADPNLEEELRDAPAWALGYDLASQSNLLLLLAICRTATERPASQRAMTATAMKEGQLVWTRSPDTNATLPWMSATAGLYSRATSPSGRLAPKGDS